MYSFDGTPLVSQNSDLLNCDYTIHPQWLLDKPSTNPALWYDTSDLDASDYDAQAEPTILSQQNSITDESGWTEKEKDLLNRGIEIFGKSSLNLSQFIGSRTPAEVKYFLKNFYSDVQLSYTSVNEDILFDNCVEETVVTSANVLQEYEIPASIEEVIDAVSTADTTTVQRKRTNSTKKLNGGGSHISYDKVPCGQSLLRSNYQKSRQDSILKGNSSPRMKQRSPKVKFKTKLKVLTKNVRRPSVKSPIARKIEKSPIKHRRKQSESDSSQKSQESDGLEVKKDLRIVTGNGPGVPVCDGEVVVKIIKENDTESDTDVDIDVEDGDDFIKTKDNSTIPQIKTDKVEEKHEVDHPPDTQKDLKTSNVKKNNLSNLNKSLPKRGPQFEELPESVIKDLLSMEEPTAEVSISREEISDVEKYLFYEFFEGRPTKTPERYLHVSKVQLVAYSQIYIYVIFICLDS